MPSDRPGWAAMTPRGEGFRGVPLFTFDALWRTAGAWFGSRGAANVAAAALAVLLSSVVLLPLLLVAVTAFRPASALGVVSEEWARPPAGPVTTAWVGYVLRTYGGTLMLSLRLASLAVVVALLVGLPAAYAFVRHPFPGSALLEEIVLLPLTLPGIAVAIALIVTFAFARGNWLLLLAGHALYTVPLFVRSVTVTLRSLPIGEYEEAAATLGAPPAMRFLLVALPALRQATTLGALLVFAVSWGEFNVSFLLVTPLTKTFPAALFAAYTEYSAPIASAATAIFLAIAVPLLIVVQTAGRLGTPEEGQAACRALRTRGGAGA